MALDKSQPQSHDAPAEVPQGIHDAAAAAWGPGSRNFDQLDAVGDVLTRRFSALDTEHAGVITQAELQLGATNPNFTPAEQTALKFAADHYQQIKDLYPHDERHVDTGRLIQVHGIDSHDLGTLQYLLHPQFSRDPYAEHEHNDHMKGAVNGAMFGGVLGGMFGWLAGPLWPAVIPAGAVVGSAIGYKVSDPAVSESDYYAQKRHTLESM